MVILAQIAAIVVLVIALLAAYPPTRWAAAELALMLVMLAILMAWITLLGYLAGSL